MALILATGSNLGDRKANLAHAKEVLSRHFKLVAESHIYESKAVEKTDQPDFLNQVLQFRLPAIDPEEVMDMLLQIERELGRTRETPKGPRTIDIDLLFFGKDSYQGANVTVPHPRLFERSFVVRPLSELPYFPVLRNLYQFPDKFQVEAYIVDN